ncbi:extracellular solute-binding protein [Paenibacillus sp. LMG 31461]|uniref:Extracellular solute-binding protein n=1 Tax=Paenibacillus plantarum TaxID=2654975 RepID=A0ABX1XG39_9BACL|nr:ABC transporter substrate-binding protein [Paenibacillus plantarum]NOU67376.1 extracellular solute-binding protein [Paenibacillus plantarum]
MYRNKKLSVLLMFVLVFTVVIAGCSSKDKSTSSSPEVSANTKPNASPENGLSKDEKVKIKIAIDENGYGRAWVDNAIKIFTTKYPNVSFETTASPKIGEMVNTKIAANNDTDMFDIFPGTANVTTIMKLGKVEAIDDLWERELSDAPGKKLKDILADGVYDNHARYDGKTYNIPVGGYTAGLFFDTVLFDKNGWNKSPQTWDEFVKLLADIKATGLAPITYAGVYPDYLYSFGLGVKPFEIAENNGTLDAFIKNFRNDQLPKYASPENIEMWQKIYGLGQKGYFAPGLAAMNHTQSQMMMLQHKAALVPTGDWIQNEMKTAIPEGFKWGFMTIPFGNDPKQTKWIANDAGSGGMLIWANKPELTKKWAKEFLLSLTTLEVQTFNAENAGIFPVRKDFTQDAARMAKVQDAPRAVLDYIAKNKTRFESMRILNRVDDPAAVSAKKIFTEAVNQIALGNQDPVPILEKADKKFKEAIDAQKK